MSTYPKQQQSKKTLIVIGGGAAGFFCAVNAARMDASLNVIILEKSGKLLSKVRISGGGRCNLTHSLFDITEMSKRYPRGQHFVKKTFHRFFTKDTIQWFEKRGVKLKAEQDGRMFPVSDSSQSIISCLLNEASIYNVEIRMNAEVKRINHINNKFILTLHDSSVLRADFVTVACGGYPKTSMFEWIQSLGHTIAYPVPSLFTFNFPSHPILKLMGVSVEKARIKISGTKLVEEGPLLITHWGLSGPCVLKLSAWGARQLAEMKYHFNIHINWVPAMQENEIRQSISSARKLYAPKKVVNYNFTSLPNRLWLFFLQESGINNEMRFADLPAKAEQALIRSLNDYIVEVKGKTTYKDEFVTAGGINLSEVDARTMMSRKIQNLFFSGEILDIDGITGGFNFQHAWTSGYIAAESVAATQIEF